MRQFLEFTEAMNQINEKFDLNDYEIKILDMVAVAHISRKPIYIRELIHCPNIASQATLHASVKKLIGKKLLSARQDKKDGRSKTVVLTKLALNRYEELNYAMRYRKIA